MGPQNQSTDERLQSYYETCCQGKMRHRSKSQAKIERKRLASESGTAVRMFDVYRCVFCRFVHIGHRNEMSGRYSESRYQEATA